MKRIFRIMICAALCLGMCAAASADAVPRSALTYDTSYLEMYAGYTENGGEWRCTDGRMAALLDAVAAGEITNSLAKGQCFFSLTLAGSSRAGTLRPEMTLYMFKKTALDVRAVTFIVNGRAYDIQANVTRGNIGGAPCEVCRLPLTEELLPLAEALSSAKSARVIVMGAEGVYELSPAKGGSTLEDASLDCFGLYNELAAMGGEVYSLWDVSGAEWKAEGLETVSRVSDDKKDALVKPGDKGDSLTEAQELLAKAGFYAGKKELTAGDKTFAAVCRAQKYYGLPVSGTADSALLSRLKNEPYEEEAEIGIDASVISAEGFDIELTGWYAAKEARTDAGVTGIAAADSDNDLIICKGAYANRGTAQLSLNWDISAFITVDGAEYSASLRAVTNGGAGYSTIVLPYAAGDVLITAEAPASAIANAESITLTVTRGETQIETALSK